jgi:hypothetical protein
MRRWRRFTLADMRRIARERDGKCLSKTYKAIYSPLLWSCNKSHPNWWATAASIVKGSWCQPCVRERVAAAQRNSISEYQKIANQRGGRLLSIEYKNNIQKLSWECGLGHKWESRALHVKRGGWCPICSTGIGERICRQYFEYLFECKFPKTRPQWLIGRSGKRMELDGYSERLKIAFEHHGSQHFNKKTIFITTSHMLESRKEADRLKRSLCRKNGVRLIEIPEVPKLTPIKNLRNVIYIQCKKNGISLPRDFRNKQVSLLDAFHPKDLIELKKLAKQKGGKLLSEQYMGVMTPHEWQCAKGHTWFARPNGVKRNSWCPECAGSRKLSIKKIQALAKMRGGKCLTRIYKNGRHPVQVRCGKNHEWKTTGERLRRGAWCPYCAGTVRKTIADMKTLAKRYGGICLSKKYVNGGKKLKWSCKQGHRFSLEPGAVQQGHWCKTCAIERRTDRTRLGIIAMKQIACDRGGKCLSRKYLCNKTKLRWECRFGHRWDASPGNVKNQKTWCPICAGKNVRHNRAKRKGR